MFRQALAALMEHLEGTGPEASATFTPVAKMRLGNCLKQLAATASNVPMFWFIYSRCIADFQATQALPQAIVLDWF